MLIDHDVEVCVWSGEGPRLGTLQQSDARDGCVGRASLGSGLSLISFAALGVTLTIGGIPEVSVAA